jgi:hypothetical protein
MHKGETDNNNNNFIFNNKLHKYTVLYPYRRRAVNVETDAVQKISLEYSSGTRCVADNSLPQQADFPAHTRRKV